MPRHIGLALAFIAFATGADRPPTSRSPTPRVPVALAWADSSRLLVAFRAARSLGVVEAGTWRLVDEWELDTSPVSLAVVEGGRIGVGTGDGRLLILDPSGAVQARLDVGRGAGLRRRAPGRSVRGRGGLGRPHHRRRREGRGGHRRNGGPDRSGCPDRLARRTSRGGRRLRRPPDRLRPGRPRLVTKLAGRAGEHPRSDRLGVGGRDLLRGDDLGRLDPGHSDEHRLGPRALQPARLGPVGGT